MLMKRIGELEHIMANLIQDNKHLEERDLPEADMKEILHQRMWETNSYKTHEDQMMMYEALEKSMNRDHSEELLKDLAEACKKKKKKCDSPKTPPGSSLHQPPPPPPAAPSSSKIATSAEYKAWTMTDTRLRLSVSLTPEDLQMDDDMALDEDRPATPEPAWSILSSDVLVLKKNWASAIASTYSPPLENSLLAQTGDMAMFMDWFCKRQGITELKPQDLEGPIFELVKVFHPNVTKSFILMHNVSKPLLLGGPLGQMWIDEECKYDIAAMYGISYWWFQRQRFYIDRHTSEGDRRAIRTHMRILSVVRIEVFSMYGYDYIKKIVLRRADLNEHIIAEQDFKYLYPSDFEDLYLLNLQGHLNHLPPKDKKILTTAVNLWTRHLDRYGVQMIMRFNEIHKFSDDTLHQIDKALDYRVKEFKVNRMNLGLNTRFWTRKDVDISKEFMFAIQKRLKTMRIFNLESFIGGRVRDGDYRLLKRTERSHHLGNIVGFNSLVHSFHALSTLRRFGLRTASATAKPSRRFFGTLPDHRIPTVAAAGQRDVNSQPRTHTSNSLSMT
nr:hypothetical protein [Tanacetum cinerariifolium]